MVEDSQNGLCAKNLQRQRILPAWTPGLLTLKVQLGIERATLNSIRIDQGTVEFSH